MLFLVCFLFTSSNAAFISSNASESGLPDRFLLNSELEKSLLSLRSSFDKFEISESMFLVPIAALVGNYLKSLASCSEVGRSGTSFSSSY